MAATLKIYVIFSSNALVCFAERHTLLNKITNIGSSISDLGDATANKILLIGNSPKKSTWNQALNASIDFVRGSKRFEEPLLNS